MNNPIGYAFLKNNSEQKPGYATAYLDAHIKVY